MVSTIDSMSYKIIIIITLLALNPGKEIKIRYSHDENLRNSTINSNNIFDALNYLLPK